MLAAGVACVPAEDASSNTAIEETPQQKHTLRIAVQRRTSAPRFVHLTAEWHRIAQASPAVLVRLGVGRQTAGLRPSALGLRSPVPRGLIISAPRLPVVKAGERLLTRGGDAAATCGTAMELLLFKALRRICSHRCP